MKILLVEDNEKISDYFKKLLSTQHYIIDCVYDGLAAEEFALANRYDLIILDIVLPMKDGVSVCKSIRSHKINVPILVITSKSELKHKLAAFDSGADDYLTKPFEDAEFLARARALLRRPQNLQHEILQAQDICMDISKHKVYKGDIELALTLKEYVVLEYFLRNKGHFITREQILENCWDLSFESFSNIVDAYIKQLRKKLNDQEGKYIKTIRGIGYVFC